MVLVLGVVLLEIPRLSARSCTCSQFASTNAMVHVSPLMYAWIPVQNGMTIVWGLSGGSTRHIMCGEVGQAECLTLSHSQ
jgi:hypothetical protein